MRSMPSLPSLPSLLSLPSLPSAVLSTALILLAPACSEDGPARTDDATSGQDLTVGEMGITGDAGLNDTTAADGPARQDGGGLCPADELAPWAGGASYYAAWTNGPPSDPSFFPIAVWLQNPSRAAEYQAIGINLYVGLWEGPTEGQLGNLAQAQMPVFCHQDSTGLSSANNALIQAWTQQDEPDNAQPKPDGSGYDPCVDPVKIQQLYTDMKAQDPTRPVYLNLGKGVADEDWIGRGTCTGMLEHYPEYIKGADIVSYDIYPAVEDDPKVAGKLWYVARGVKRLREWADYKKPVWNWIETTHINNPNVRVTPSQVRSEVWMSLIHGSMGIGYFAHEFAPSFIEAGLLAYDDIKQEVSTINAQITALAPVLNTPSVQGGVTVSSSNAQVEVATLLKRYGGATYLFAVAMEDQQTTATFELTCVPEDATVEVLEEGRSLTMSGRSFSDDFSGYGVHLYKVAHQ